jgi:hypothetical protein
MSHAGSVTEPHRFPFSFLHLCFIGVSSVARFCSYWSIVAHRRNQKRDVRWPFTKLKTDGVRTPLDQRGEPTFYLPVAPVRTSRWPFSAKPRSSSRVCQPTRVPIVAVSSSSPRRSSCAVNRVNLA